MTAKASPTKFEETPHTHSAAKLSKAELAVHLTVPHLQAEGGWRSVSTPVFMIRGWSRQELERTHGEFHQTQTQALYCRECDGVGWVEGGAVLQTTCVYCGGTGHQS